MSRASISLLDVSRPKAWSLKASTPFINPLASTSRRKRSKLLSNARRSARRSSVTPFKTMSALPAPLGLNGACATPRNPGDPASAHSMCPIFGDRPMNGGTAGSTGPWSLDRTEPSDGQPPAGALRLLRPVRHWMASWPPVAPTIERISTSLSMSRAICGRCWQIWMPGTLVEIGENSPRISDGASIFRSNRSWCDGPPGRKIMMTALCDRRIPDSASARSSCGRASPPRPRAPIRRKFRRDTPSQNRCGLPRIVSIKTPLCRRPGLPRSGEAVSGRGWASSDLRTGVHGFSCFSKRLYSRKIAVYVGCHGTPSQRGIEGVPSPVVRE